MKWICALIACLWLSSPAWPAIEVSLANPLPNASGTNKGVAEKAVETRQDVRGAAKDPLFVSVVESQSDAQEKAASIAHRVNEAANSRLMWQLTLGMLVVAAVQAGFFWWQLRMIRENSIDAKKSADAAEKAADIAERSLLTVREQTTLQLRAYVAVVDFPQTIVLNGDGGVEGWLLATEWRNGGSTPARNISFWVSGEPVQGYTDEQVLNFPNPQFARDYTAVLIQGQSSTTGGIFVSLPLLRQIYSGQAAYFLRGRMEYNDVFSNEIRRHTEFFMQVVVVNDGLNQHAAPMSFRSYHSGNSDS